MLNNSDNYRKLLHEERRRSDGLAETIQRRIEKGYGLRHIHDFHNKSILSALQIEGPTCPRLLEVGCGIGSFLREAVRFADNVFGVDLGMYNTRQAYRNTQSKAKVMVADGKFLPFSSNYFDAVVAKGLIHHLVDPLGVMQEISRVLTSDGRIVIFEGDPQALYRRIVLGVADMIGLEHEVTQFRHLKALEIVTLLNDSGFRDIRIRRVSQPFIPLGLQGLGQQRLWGILDYIAKLLAPMPFNWYLLMTARAKNS
jgi:SAM-dependent methyltransferase